MRISNPRSIVFQQKVFFHIDLLTSNWKIFLFRSALEYCNFQSKKSKQFTNSHLWKKKEFQPKKPSFQIWNYSFSKFSSFGEEKFPTQKVLFSSDVIGSNWVLKSAKFLGAYRNTGNRKISNPKRGQFQVWKIVFSIRFFFQNPIYTEKMNFQTKKASFPIGLGKLSISNQKSFIFLPNDSILEKRHFLSWDITFFFQIPVSWK